MWWGLYGQVTEFCSFYGYRGKLGIVHFLCLVLFSWVGPFPVRGVWFPSYLLLVVICHI
jgi:hypothetical protein